MSHVLVKWTEEGKWDVYPVRAVVDVAVRYRLLTEEAAIEDLRGAVLMFQWKKNERAAPAELLDIGKPRALEEKRARLAAARAATEDNAAAARACSLSGAGHDEASATSCAGNAEQVDIGGGILVDEGTIEGLRRNCPGAPAKFSRRLIWHLCTPEELRGEISLWAAVQCASHCATEGSFGPH
ncbi:hypothetical protein HPB50_014540 [Hyalomma asiaticum]|uniref:Uncharacterized protein n=1 Tax=Hyalomma asiaticum TaxID=266040 RepID=A0ACB7SFM0_HYAAI|nr:hypothetical protein HPB50_014540 [Hyalomma asiaticum]